MKNSTVLVVKGVGDIKNEETRVDVVIWETAGVAIVSNADLLQQYTSYRNCLVEAMLFRMSRVQLLFWGPVFMPADFARATEENGVWIIQQMCHIMIIFHDGRR